MCTRFYIDNSMAELKEIFELARKSAVADRFLKRYAKPSFSESWSRRRCVIPASYYYEWKHYKSIDGRDKTGAKYLIQPKGASITWLCGLYRIENDIPVFTVLTREPSGEVSQIHDRMPLILPESVIDEWITPSNEYLIHSGPGNIITFNYSLMI